MPSPLPQKPVLVVSHRQSQRAQKHIREFIEELERAYRAEGAARMPVLGASGTFSPKAKASNNSRPSARGTSVSSHGSRNSIEIVTVSLP
jgi:exopolyphosphatase/pppGpp-phosphohydrolase